MNFKEMKDTITQLQKEHYEDFIKALISIEKGIDDEQGLTEVYEKYLDDDSMGILDENFDYIIDELEENGKLNREPVTIDTVKAAKEPEKTDWTIEEINERIKKVKNKEVSPLEDNILKIYGDGLASNLVPDKYNKHKKESTLDKLTKLKEKVQEKTPKQEMDTKKNNREMD